MGFWWNRDRHQGDVIASRFAELSPPIPKGMVGDLLPTAVFRTTQSTFCLLLWVVMGYLLCIFKLPDYDMPGTARKDVVLLGVTLQLSTLLSSTT